MQVMQSDEIRLDGACADAVRSERFVERRKKRAHYNTCEGMVARMTRSG